MGTHEEEEEFKMLEEMLQSNTFKKAKEVRVCVCVSACDKVYKFGVGKK